MQEPSVCGRSGSQFQNGPVKNIIKVPAQFADNMGMELQETNTVLMDAERLNRRRSERPKLRKAITLCWQEGGKERSEETYTISISLFGCSVENSGHLKPNSTVRTQHEGRGINGKIIYNLKDSSKPFIEVGIGFEIEAEQFWGYTF